jgi:hypothetical protein
LTRASLAERSDTREHRGIALYLNRGDEFERIGDYRWKVPSRTTEGKKYTVDLTIAHCGCYDHVYNGCTCLHVYAGEIASAKQRAKRLRRAA